MSGWVGEWMSELVNEWVNITFPERSILQLWSGYCKMLWNYQAKIKPWTGQRLLPSWNVSPHDTNHLLSCRENPTTLTAASLGTKPTRRGCCVYALTWIRGYYYYCIHFSGQQGKEINRFDLLPYIFLKVRKNELASHAWLPFQISSIIIKNDIFPMFSILHLASKFILIFALNTCLRVKESV